MKNNTGKGGKVHGTPSTITRPARPRKRTNEA